MKIPKIKFREMTLDENIDLVKWAYFQDNGPLSVHEYTIKYFKDLANIDKDMSKDEICKIIEKVVSLDYEKNKEKIKTETVRYNEIWEKYNEPYFTMLSDFLGVSFPNDLDIIVGKVGLIPVFPRYLDEFSFSLSTGIEEWKIIESCAHETLHFLWFEKWKQMHPETPRREYDPPFVTWEYSEMVTDPILNNPPFSDLFSFVERGYDSFYSIYDGEELVMDKLRNIYSEDISVEEKIDKGFMYINSLDQFKNKK